MRSLRYISLDPAGVLVLDGADSPLRSPRQCLVGALAIEVDVRMAGSDSMRWSRLAIILSCLEESLGPVTEQTVFQEDFAGHHHLSSYFPVRPPSVGA